MYSKSSFSWKAALISGCLGVLAACTTPERYRWFRVCRAQATVTEIGICASDGACAVKWSDGSMGTAPFPMVGKTYNLDCVWTTTLDDETRAKYPYGHEESNRPYR